MARDVDHDPMLLPDVDRALERPEVGDHAAAS